MPGNVTPAKAGVSSGSALRNRMPAFSHWLKFILSACYKQAVEGLV